MQQKMKKILMIGPARNVKGGMTTVVDNYYYSGIEKFVDIKYIETINDKSKLSKFLKEVKGYFEFMCNIKKYDLVHIHMASGRSTFRKCQYIRKSKQKLKKVIVHIHGAEFKQFYYKCSDKKQNYIKNTLNMCDKVVVLSEEWKEFFSKIIDSSRIEVIYNGIILPQDFTKNVDSNKMLFLGKIGDRKGIYDLIDVISKLVNLFPDIILYVGGDGEVDKLNSLIKSKKLTNNVKYVGWVTGENKNKLLKESSFYILPSYNEGMPMSVLEGMAYKNVTISTNVGGIPKVIIDEENGFLINPGDKEKLYNIIKTLLENKSLRKKISERGRKTIENNFNVNLNLKKILSLYDSLI